MVLINELRPNNLYIVECAVVVLEDHLHDGNDMLLYFHGYSCSFKIQEVEPIPLNSDWLSELGLRERYTKNEWSWANCTPGRVWDSCTEVRLKKDGNGCASYSYLKGYPALYFVHQLQNLYNAITREELNYASIKLTADQLQIKKLEQRISYLQNGLDVLSQSAARGANTLTTDDPRFSALQSQLSALSNLAIKIKEGTL